MTFRLKTALLIVTLSLLTMGAAFTGVWYYFVSAQRAHLDRELLRVANREAQEAALGMLEFSDLPGPTANSVGPLPKYGVLFDSDDKVVVSTSNFRLPPRLPDGVAAGECFDLEHERGPLRAVLVEVSERSGMKLLLASPRADFEEDARILRMAMTVAFVLGCCWTGVVTWLAASRLTRPYHEIEAVARKVAGGDVTARVHFESRALDFQPLADDLNTMIDQLVNAAAAQERFVANAAHELRTPLTALRIELEYALQSAGDLDEAREAMRGALESGKRLSTLADDLLTVARSRAKSELEMQADLRACVADAVLDVELVARRRGVRVDWQRLLPTMVCGERRSVARIVRNLLENAVRFSKQGQTIELGQALSSEEVRLWVDDQGPGVPPEQRERIFEPFERAAAHPDASVEIKTSGLGLAIARDLARSHGGDLRACDRDGNERGARFELRLPRPHAAPGSGSGS